MGGKRFTLSRSILDRYPAILLTAASFKTWQHDQDEEAFIDGNGQRFQYVLDYLRDGTVDLPMHETRYALVTELEYFNVEVDVNRFNYAKGPSAYGLNQVQNAILSWRYP